MKKILLLLLVFVGGMARESEAQVGTSCANPYIIYPATSCSNTCGAQYCGNMQCPTGDCGSYVTMSGSSGGLNPACTPDNETTQNVMWLRVTATGSSFTIDNGKPYVGSGAAAANTKDYVVYSGTCGSLTQIGCYTLGGSSSATITGLIAGQVYYIMASPANTNTTANAISTCITSTTGYAAPGNTCAGALSLSTNVTYTYNNAGATANGPICSGSVENNVWYQWCAPSNWPSGQTAYVSVYNQVCNSSLGLQLSVWNTNTTCPSSSANANVICQNPGTLTQYYYQWTPVANQCYYVTIDGYAGSACQYNITVGSIIALPIELISFNAKNKTDDVLLTWTTATEINNSYFTLEKSKDGNRFTPFQQVEGAGNSSTVKNYSALDPYPYPGINYYRLKQTDYDGTFSYSEVIAIQRKSDARSLVATPQAAAGKVDIRYFSPATGTAMLRINDATGKLMYSMPVEVAEGLNTYKIDKTFLTPGVFVLSLEGEQDLQTTRFLIAE